MIIKNLNTYKDNLHILKNINLELEENKMHIIMGPNGSGKSTLLSSLMKHPDYEVKLEEFSFNNINYTEMPTEELFLNGVFYSMQQPPVIEGLSNSFFIKEVLQNKDKFNNLNTSDEFKILKNIKQKSTEFKFKDNYYKNNFNVGFSGGEKKRNEILQIDLFKPKLLLLDEIDSGVDLENMKFIANFINEYKKHSTIILVSHYPEFLNLLDVDFIHVLKNGEFIKHGSNELISKIQSNGFTF